MAHYIIHTPSNNLDPSCYVGVAWFEAGLVEQYKHTYTDRYEAEELARKLSKFSPVGFTVLKVEDD